MTIETIETQPEPQRPQPRTVTLTIKKVSVVDGRNGDQYELETMGATTSQYPERFWMDCSLASAQPRAGDQVRCVISVRDLKGGKEGNSDWDYRWRIDQWDVDTSEQHDQPSGQIKDNTTPEDWSRSKPAVTRAPAAAQPPAWEEQPMKPDHPSKRRSIERQASLKAAIDYLEDKESTSDLLVVASLFYEWVSAPPEAAQVPPEAPESPIEPDATFGWSDGAEPSIQGGSPVPVTAETVLPAEGEAIDTVEQFGAAMKQLGITREQARGALGGKEVEDWIDGRLRTVNAALIQVKNNRGIK